jgi:ribosomal protein S18 acetylase RimI-like enzyme
MQIIPVTGRRTMRSFITFPRTLYREDPFWVPPMWHEERKAYKGSTNVMLRDTAYILLLVYDRGKLLGRSLVYIDQDFNRYYGAKTGFFGAFECVDDEEASAALFDASVQWLAERGMDTLRGPIHPVAESWGFLLKGHESLPVLMASYNPPYYHSLMERSGLVKVKDLLAYEADMATGYVVPQRIGRFARQLHSRHPELSVRRIDTKHLMRDAEHIWRITNTALAENWGYVPVDKPVMEDMVRRLKVILDADAIWFVEDDGEPVGFALGFPDPNAIIKAIGGRLLPVGFLKLLFERKRIRRYRLLALGVLPQYHGMGLDVLLYKHLYDALSHRNILMEANYILEDNWKIRNALEKLGMTRTKEYRVYERSIP